MENENETKNDEFVVSKTNIKSKSSRKTNSNFGNTVVVPFLSGIVGAGLVVGTCFGVPSIKQSILRGTSYNTSYTSTESSEPAVAINIAEYSETASHVADKVLPSVVGITITYQINSFFGSSTSDATGSGIIISEDGYILTNNHVVSSESSSAFYAITGALGVKVKLYGDDTEYEAKIVGTDAITDLAVLKIEASGLTPAVLGNSDNVKVGEFVLAVGNPLGMDYTVTGGIVSALDREVASEGTTYTAIQTDAAINSGNSGGALVNSKGEVIGINTMKLAGTGIEGIGFAIPISSTSNIVEQLINYSEVKRPYIGISGSSINKEISEKYNLPEGILIEDVYKDTPAEKAGIKKSDIITKIEGVEVKTISELNKVKNKYNIGDTVTLTISRNNQEEEFKVKLEEEKKEEKENVNTNVQTQDPFGGSIFDFFYN